MGRQWRIEYLRVRVGLCLHCVHCAREENPTSASCKRSHEQAGEPAEDSIDEPAEEPTKLRVTEKLEENCFCIQVSAKHLILASSVYQKILTGGWKESITYLQKGSVEITADSWADASISHPYYVHKDLAVGLGEADMENDCLGDNAKSAK